MNIQSFLEKFENSTKEDYLNNLHFLLDRDNLEHCKEICDFIEINHHYECYRDLFDISFNKNCINIFKYLWKKHREYDNHDIIIHNDTLNKKSKIGKFYFDELMKEENVYGTFIVHCYKLNKNNISHILSYITDKNFKKRLCNDGFYLCSKDKYTECSKLILHQNKRYIISENLFEKINERKILKKTFHIIIHNIIQSKRDVYK